MRFAICAALLVLGSCSSEPAKPVTPPAQQPVADKPAEKPAEKPTEKPAEKPADPAPAADVASFAVNGNDMMQFDVKQLEVKPGQRVRIVFKNVGSIAKVAMGHNLVVLRKGVSVAEFTPQVMGPKGTLENDYLPAEAKKDVLVATKLLGPGESETIEFTAPGLPGELAYVCTFPGHFALMTGKIIVR